MTTKVPYITAYPFINKDGETIWRTTDPVAPGDPVTGAIENTVNNVITDIQRDIRLYFEKNLPNIIVGLIGIFILLLGVTRIVFGGKP